MEPKEFKDLVKEAKKGWEALGKVTFGCSKGEEKSRQFRRSVYVAEDINVGEIFTDKNVRVVRPGYGMEPEFYESIIGRKSRYQLKKGDALTFDKVFGGRE